MSFKIRTLVLACLLVAFGWGGANAQPTQFTLDPGSGGQLQIGTGLPLPVGSAGIYLGGMTSMNGATVMLTLPGGVVTFTDGPGTAYWPPLDVPPASPAPGAIVQNQSTAQGGAIQVPAGVLSKPAAGTPVAIAVFPTNPAVFQVATSISYAWPAAAATLAPGGGPGIPGTTVVLGTPGPSIIAYSAGAKSFGGAARFSVSPGPGAGTSRVPPNGMGALPVASVWINGFKKAPMSVTKVGLVGASNMNGFGQPGAPTTAPPVTTSFGPGFVVFVNGSQVPTPTGPLPCPPACPVGPAGTITNSLQVTTAAFPSNMVTNTTGFPWTTGFIQLSAMAATGAPELFFESGTDMRVSGVGNISLVSGALSNRALSGPNANRGWLSLTLPEPSVALGAAGALAMLGLCHGLVRRRS